LEPEVDLTGGQVLHRLRTTSVGHERELLSCRPSREIDGAGDDWRKVLWADRLHQAAIA
jgi:hypothetical protein